jgi:general stress protein YciG
MLHSKAGWVGVAQLTVTSETGCAPEAMAVRGFAGMSPDRQRAIASLGGKAAHRKGTAHRWTPDEAAAFGRKGGHHAHRAPQGGSMDEKRQTWPAETAHAFAAQLEKGLVDGGITCELTPQEIARGTTRDLNLHVNNAQIFSGLGEKIGSGQR